MAEVWEASHVHLRNQVALKFLLPQFIGNQELQERFLNEAKSQAQLRHPNIVPATDFFQLEGRSYMVMQYIEGANLEARLEKGNAPFTLDEIHSISWDVLSALEYAHALSIVHRDVKPSNMLMDRSGRVLLMDFGIAKALREERSVTLTGAAMGTPEYMSPEQILRPKEVDARSDIYSFGCVLYALLSGNPPFGFEGATAFKVQQGHVHETPPPLVHLNRDIPASVDWIVLKCLEKDPKQRFQSCSAVMRALESAVAGGEQPPSARSKTIAERPAMQETIKPPTSSKGVSKYILAATAVVLIAILGVAYFLYHGKTNADAVQPSSPKDWTRASFDDPAFSDCGNVPACLAKKADAEKLKAVADWKQIRDDDPMLKDCMNYQPCLGRARQLSPKDPSTGRRKAASGGASGGEEDWPACCKDASNPAECKAYKKREGIQGDCSGPFSNN